MINIGFDAGDKETILVLYYIHSGRALGQFVMHMHIPISYDINLICGCHS